MASQKEVRRWFLDHHRELSLKVKHLTWTREWLPGYFDFEVQIDVGGVMATGRGTAKEEELAFVKACAEAYERHWCISNKVCSNGIAAHTSEQKAKESSCFELIERDRALCHFLTQYPMREIPSTDLKPAFLEAVTKISRANCLLKIFELKPLGRARTVACFGFNVKRPGVSIGFGCSTNFETGMEKAFLESVGRLSHSTFSDSREYGNVSEIQAGPGAHQEYWDKKDDALEFLEVFPKTNGFDDPFVEPIHFEFEQLEVGHPLLENCPLVLTKAKTDQLLPMFYGRPNFSEWQMDYLAQFSQQPFDLLKLNRELHWVA